MFLIRVNPDFITIIVSLIEETDDQESVDSLIELFYDNKTIGNPEQGELLILTYKLLEEITPMNSASVDEFLNETTFFEKFISFYMNEKELKIF